MPKTSWITIVTEDGHEYYVDHYTPGTWRLWIFGQHIDLESLDAVVEYIDAHHVNPN